jgi:hypothetical protein
MTDARTQNRTILPRRKTPAQRKYSAQQAVGHKASQSPKHGGAAYGNESLRE